MGKIGVLDKVYLGFMAIMITANTILYQALPDQIGIHETGGVMDSFVDKWLFLILIPSVMAAYFLFSNLIRNESEKRRLLVGAVLVAVNGMILFMNI